MDNWQPIETAPQDGTQVLVSGPSYNDPSYVAYVTIALFDPEYGEWREGLNAIYAPTHWMPLPPSPLSSRGEG